MTNKTASEDSFETPYAYNRIELSKVSDGDSPVKVSLCNDSFKSPIQEDAQTPES